MEQKQSWVVGMVSTKQGGVCILKDVPGQPGGGSGSLLSSLFRVFLSLSTNISWGAAPVSWALTYWPDHVPRAHHALFHWILTTLDGRYLSLLPFHRCRSRFWDQPAQQGEVRIGVPLTLQTKLLSRTFSWAASCSLSQHFCGKQTPQLLGAVQSHEKIGWGTRLVQ